MNDFYSSIDNRVYDSNLGTAILQDIQRWDWRKEDEIFAAAERIQSDMKIELEEASPIRRYPWNNGEVMRIMQHRNAETPKAEKIKLDKDQPGHFARGWRECELKNVQHRRVLGVRNKDWSLPHLLNFDHRHMSHRIYVGDIKGSHFIEKIQEKGQKRLDEEIKRIFEED